MELQQLQSARGKSGRKSVNRSFYLSAPTIGRAVNVNWSRYPIHNTMVLLPNSAMWAERQSSPVKGLVG
jgi:hypothetical protein